ncbi:MAG: hypothetical protein WD077_06200 [Bacteroidia bacterium]
MKKLLTFTITLFVALLMLSSCKKVEPPEYTISGTILKAPDQPVPVPKLQWEVVVLDPEQGMAGKIESLGFFTPDQQGNFSFTYKQTDIDRSTASIEMYSDGPGYFKVREIPVNQEVNDTFYTRGPSWGTLRIYLKPLKPLADDTLLIGFPELVSGRLYMEMDTIFSEINGFWREMRFPTPYTAIHYGRGFSEFYFDPIEHNVKWSNHISPYIDGDRDPIVNEVTIEY